MREAKNSKRMQSIPNKKHYQRTTSKKENGERNASDTDIQDNEMQDSPFRPSELNELGTSLQPV